MAERCALVSELARATPPNLPRATAFGFFFVAMPRIISLSAKMVKKELLRFCAQRQTVLRFLLQPLSWRWLSVAPWSVNWPERPRPICPGQLRLGFFLSPCLALSRLALRWSRKSCLGSALSGRQFCVSCCSRFLGDG